MLRAPHAQVEIWQRPDGWSYPRHAPVKLKSLRRRWYAGRCSLCLTWFVHDQPQTMTCSPRCYKKLAKAKRRALERDAFVENVSPRKVFDRDRWKCQLCRKPVKRDAIAPHPRAPVIDHIIPLAAGGTHEPANVQCAHFLCNSIKGARGGGQLLLIG
jgi:5-methylcytosine-specific restriction endonuclease McrA